MKFFITGLATAALALFGFFLLSDTNAESLPSVGTPPVPPKAIQVKQVMVPEEASLIQIALILDTSGSMSGLIDQARAQLWKMVNELAGTTKNGHPVDIEIALYQYGNSRLLSIDGYVQQILPFTRDLDAISEELFKLTTSGGDEYNPWAIVDAATELSWSKDTEALRLVFLAGNEDFAQGPVTVPEACKAAADHDLIVNPIFCGPYQEGSRLGWSALGDCTPGRYLNIDHNDEVVHVPTPFDDEVNSLNVALNETYIGYGRNASIAAENQMAQDMNAASVSSANARTRAFAKSKRAYNNASWDLVDRTQAEPEAIREIEKEQLPENMRSMSEEERVAYVQELSERRAAIKQQLVELEVKVNAYVVEKREEMGQAATLDEVLIGAMREQAVANGFRWE